jgi:Carboxypeptidase regulatory-like domain
VFTFRASHRNHPSGAKARRYFGVFGTAKAVPFPSHVSGTATASRYFGVFGTAKACRYPGVFGMAKAVPFPSGVSPRHLAERRTGLAVKYGRSVLIAVTAAIVLVGTALAQGTVTGTVTDGTTGKPAANAEVILIAPMQGMQEIAKTKTDASGKYSLQVPDATPHLVRVMFHDVPYNHMAPPGRNTADMTVYESAKKVDGIGVSVETAYQSDSGKLQAVQFYSVRNASKPPRTQAGEQTFVITLPEGAEIDAARVQAPGGQPIEQSPTKVGTKGDYAFSYPVRPGETVFQVGYHLPYSGELAVTPKLSYPILQWALVMPNGMNVETKTASAWESPQHQGGITLKIAANPGNKDLSYRISGTGTLPDEQAEAQGGGGAGGAGGAENGPRPGGGIGAPIDAPDPLSRFRLPLLTMLAGMLALGALFMVSRRGAPARSPAKMRSALMEELKEQLFELELDRKQGRISQEQYTSNKAALDATMERALGKKTSS